MIVVFCFERAECGHADPTWIMLGVVMVIPLLRMQCVVKMITL